MSLERRAAMTAYGAEILLVTELEGMEGARDLALKMQNDDKGFVLNQFANEDNLEAHLIQQAQKSGKIRMEKLRILLLLWELQGQLLEQLNT